MNEAVKHYTDSADLGNVQAQFLLTSRNIDTSHRINHSELIRINDLETSLARDLEEMEHESNEMIQHTKHRKGSSLSRNLEKLAASTSTIPTNQYIKGVGSYNQIRQYNHPTSLLSEGFNRGVAIDFGDDDE